MARRLNIDTPKELVLVNNKAVIEYGIEQLIGAGIQHIVFVIRAGKESIQEHVQWRYPQLSVQFVYQTGVIGNLIDGIQAAYSAIRGKTVYFCMADVVITPNPFLIRSNHELSILCQKVTDTQWRHLGVIDPVHHKIVDKPNEFISDICWGALVWHSSFTETIMQATNLTDAMNCSQWEYFVNIERYTDIGIDQSHIQPIVTESSNGHFPGETGVGSKAVGQKDYDSEQNIRYEFVG